MNLSDFKKQNLPDNPGVYFFKKGREILYIGKATSLRDRVRSYFSDDLIKTRGPALVDMVTQSNSVDFQDTDSVLEALILESTLIKKHQPKYNTKERDDKSFNFVIVTNEKFPRILLVRGHDLKTGKFDAPIKNKYGPFTNAGQLREALKLIQRIFPFFDTNKPVDQLNNVDKKRVGLNIEIGIYPNIFSEDKDSKTSAEKEYKRNIKHIKYFFEGKKKKILQQLKKQMKELSKNLEFERANEIKKTIFALDHINDIALMKDEQEIFSRGSRGGDGDSAGIGKINRIESYDIAHTAGSETVGVMIVSGGGQFQKNEYKKFIIKSTTKNDDYAALAEVLTRRFNHLEWTFPELIIIDGGKGQLGVAERFLADRIRIETNALIKSKLQKIRVISVVKDDKHKAREILGSDESLKVLKNNMPEKEIFRINEETHRFAINFHRKRRGMIK
jgi:excinuclease ABC subunit C